MSLLGALSKRRCGAPMVAFRSAFGVGRCDPPPHVPFVPANFQVYGGPDGNHHFSAAGI